MCGGNKGSDRKDAGAMGYHPSQEVASLLALQALLAHTGKQAEIETAMATET